MDTIDRKILAALQRDGRVSVTDLSEQINLSKTACTERIRRLERDGVITGYRAGVDASRLGLETTIFVQVHLDRTTTAVLDHFNREVGRIAEVEAAHMIAGGFDYLLKLRVRDMAHYRHVLGERIGSLPGVSQTHSFPVMETVSEDAPVPV